MKKRGIATYVVVGILVFAMVFSMFSALVAAIM